MTSDLKDLLWAVKKLIMEANVHKCALWGRRLRKKHCLASVIPLILGEEKNHKWFCFDVTEEWRQAEVLLTKYN